MYRSLFEAGGVRACPGCVERAAAAPTEPCEQERLHDLVLAAADGPLRDRLVAVLRQGAEITMWVNGGGESVGKHYARLDRVVEGAEALAAALRTPGRVGVARVVDDGGEFIVVLPGEGSPAIGWATAGGR